MARLTGGDEDLPFLRAILEIAEEAGSRILAAAVHHRLGLRAMETGDRLEARERFGKALATSPTPRALFTRLRILPGIQEILTPRELKGLAAMAAKKDLKEEDPDVDP